MNFSALRASLHAELLAFIRFFHVDGVDHEHGGFCCGLNHKGERLTDLKFVWFNGRGIWVYSRLYNLGVLAASPPPDSATMQEYLLEVARRVEHYHHPRMLMNAIRLCDTVIKTGGSWKCA